MPRDRLDWDDLRYLLAAARAGTLAGAARSMGVEHTTIGRRLTALERALGGSLVLRKPDGLALTAMGSRVLEAAEQVEHAIAQVWAVADEAQTRVRLAVPSGLSNLFTAELHTLRAMKPPVVLELVSGAQNVDLKKGDCDLALRLGPITDSDLVARKVGEVAWCLYAAPAYLARHPVLERSLAGHHFIGYVAALADTPPAQWLEAQATRGAIVMRSREMVDMVSAAQSGAGLALLPSHLGDAATDLCRVFPDVWVTRELWLAYRREARTSSAFKRVTGFVIAIIERHSDALHGRTRCDQ
jgi:DNA-binding transcriptional LysR family regulator